MVDLGADIFKDLNTGEIKTEELFTGAYVEGIYESKDIRTAAKQLRVILDAKYEKSDLYKVMETKCQHLTMIPSNDLLKLLHKFEELFNGTLGTWKTDPVNF